MVTRRSDDDVALGFDLGGTKIEAAVVDRAGQVLASERRPTPVAEGAPAVVAAMAEIATTLEEAMAGRRIGEVGVGVAGQVVPSSGVVSLAPNLGWEDVALGAALAESLQRPVTVLNDVQAATYGEWVHGAGQALSDIVCLFLGTGVGGGIVSGDVLLRGCSGSAGEFGHVIVSRDGPSCRAGHSGCVESFVGGWAMARNAREAVAADGEAGAALLAHAGGAVERITPSVIAGAAAAGDPLARRLMTQVEHIVGIAAGSIVNALNPCLLVLGGGVTGAIPSLADAARRGIAASALEAPGRRVQVTTAALGKFSGAVGAAAWARSRGG